MNFQRCPQCGAGLYMDLLGEKGTCAQCSRVWTIAKDAAVVAGNATTPAPAQVPKPQPGPQPKVAPAPKRVRILKR